MRTKTGSLGRMGTALAVALAVCSAVEIGLLVFRPASVALAQGGGTRTVTHTNFQDFDVCTVLPETVPRSYADTVASSADGGEIRLAAYVEDYFEDPGISATRWVTYLHDSGRLDRPAIVDGVYRTSNGGIRSQLTVPANRRVVDMRARLQEPGGSTGWGDLWFGRTILPGYSIPDQDQANRLFITDASGGVAANARTGTPPAENVWLSGVDITQFHLYRIEWDNDEARYYIDDTSTPVVTNDQDSSFEPYVWAAYTQDPGAPIDVD